MEIYSSWSYPLDMVLTGKCRRLAQASSHVPTALALAGRGALAEINDRNQRDFWEIAARNQQTV